MFFGWSWIEMLRIYIKIGAKHSDVVNCTLRIGASWMVTDQIKFPCLFGLL